MELQLFRFNYGYRNRLSGILRCLLCILLLYSVMGVARGAGESAVTGEILLKKMDELYRSDSSKARMMMIVETPHWQRSIELLAWSKTMDYTLIRVLSPKKERGVATLKREDEMWNYFPKINKVIKIPSSLMMGSWMGSDFTNDDLMRDVSLLEEYEVTLVEKDQRYQLTLIPKQMTDTVWGKIEIVIAKENLLPLEEAYFNEKGEKMRVLKFDQVKEFDGKMLPSRLELTPLNKEGHRTVLVYEELQFNLDLTEDLFSLRNLKSRVF